MNINHTTGTTEEISLTPLPISKYQELVFVIDDESRSLEIYCGKEKPWADTLTQESHIALIEEAEKINEPFFKKWLERRMHRANLISPGIVNKIVSAAIPK